MRIANNYPLLINFTSLVPASFTLLFEPSATASLESFSATKDFLVLQTLDTVKSRYIFWRYQDAASNEEGAPLGWSFRGAEESKFFAELCSVFHSDHWLSLSSAASIRGSSLSAVDSDDSNQYWLTSSSFLQVNIFVKCRLVCPLDTST